MFGYEVAYKKVQPLVDKGMRVEEACKKTKQVASQYYIGKKKAENKSKRKVPKGKYQRVETVSTPQSATSAGNVTVIMGTPEQIKAVLG
jgi:phosphoribosylformylglycinamidine (FGAM) synthase-like amidotransferase family enzyme